MSAAKIQVIKRDGSEEELSVKKIERVVVAAGLNSEQAIAFAEEVIAEIRGAGKTKISSLEIRDMVAEKLKKTDNYAYGLYSWYQQLKEKEANGKS